MFYLSPSTSIFDMLFVQICSSAYHCCNTVIIWVTAVFHQPEPVCPFSSLSLTKLFSKLLDVFHLIVSKLYKLLCVTILGNQQFLRYWNHPVWHQQSFHGQSHLDHISSPFGCLVWTTCDPLGHICCFYALKSCHDWLIRCLHICWCTGLYNKVSVYEAAK